MCFFLHHTSTYPQGSHHKHRVFGPRFFYRAPRAGGFPRRESAIGLASEGWPRDVCAPCAKELAREEEKRSPRFSVLHGSYEAYCTQVNQVRATPSAGR